MKECKQCGYNASPEACYCIMCGSKLDGKGNKKLLGSIKILLQGSSVEDELKA